MADSFLAAMTPLGVREECIYKSPSSRFPWGGRGKCLWDFSVFGKMMFSVSVSKVDSSFFYTSGAFSPVGRS